LQKKRTYIEVTSSEGYAVAAQLFKEYAIEIGIDLGFQHFDEELASLAIQYSRPEGGIFLIYNEKQTGQGCIGVRKLGNGIFELKRMYVRKEARGSGMGKELLQRAIALGVELGYYKMRLDTLSSMENAIHLYEAAGFYEIAPYRYNPFADAKFYELEL